MGGSGALWGGRAQGEADEQAAAEGGGGRGEARRGGGGGGGAGEGAEGHREEAPNAVLLTPPPPPPRLNARRLLPRARAAPPNRRLRTAPPLPEVTRPNSLYPTHKWASLHMNRNALPIFGPLMAAGIPGTVQPSLW